MLLHFCFCLPATGPSPTLCLLRSAVSVELSLSLGGKHVNEPDFLCALFCAFLFCLIPNERLKFSVVEFGWGVGASGADADHPIVTVG